MYTISTNIKRNQSLKSHNLYIYAHNFAFLEDKIKKKKKHQRKTAKESKEDNTGLCFVYGSNRFSNHSLNLSSLTKSQLYAGMVLISFYLMPSVLIFTSKVVHKYGCCNQRVIHCTVCIYNATSTADISNTAEEKKK